jgi:polysaccharide deacetylase family protein (PEP-CTERM system associated)
MSLPLQPPGPKMHLLTVALEDYFQVGAFRGLISQRQWSRFETRIEGNTDRVLALLDQYGIKATFFVLGWIAQKYPAIVRRVADLGHEIASKGFYHRSVDQMSAQEFRDELVRSRDALESATGRKVLGYRLADGWVRPQDLWIFDVLAELGYVYDSSICPFGRQFAHEPWRRFVHQQSTPAGLIWEFPISCARFLAWNLPIAGGNYFRQLPQPLMRRAVSHWHKSQAAPLVMYFHVWELDPEQPRISSSGWLTRLRHYRNLGRMQEFLEYYFQNYHFTNITEHLQLDKHLENRIGSTCRPIDDEPADAFVVKDRKPVTIVIPCYNEEQTLPYLRNTLDSVARDLQREYDVAFCLVDDGSCDNTWQTLRRLFGDRPNFQLIRHEKNQGVAAAIMTGLRAATTEIVCSMDADCTYDPHEFRRMIPLLAPSVDMVTASPYHPGGAVHNVPAWRLALSKGASWLYRRILRSQLSTYTSCFRVYRRSRIAPLKLRHGGFLGIVEMLAQLDQLGGNIIEYPTTLEVRMLGRSKMKTLRTILGHLRMMMQLLIRQSRLPGTVEGQRAQSSEAMREGGRQAVTLEQTAGS